MNKLLLTLALAAVAGAAYAQRINPSQCSAPSICLNFAVPNVQFPDGSVQTSAAPASGGAATFSSVGVTGTLTEGSANQFSVAQGSITATGLLTAPSVQIGGSGISPYGNLQVVGNMLVGTGAGGGQGGTMLIGTVEGLNDLILVGGSAGSVVKINSYNGPRIATFDTDQGAAAFGAGATRSTFTAIGGLFMATGSSITIPGAAGTVALTVGSTASFAGAVFVGLQLSTQAAGTAGTAVTALCDAGSFATGGGCSCTGGVALTDTIGVPNCATKGCVPTGYTCQDAGGTGGACAARVICSRLQ